jgi:vitamin B12 transporter
MGSNRIAFLLALGALSALPAGAAESAEIPRLEAEASAGVTVTAEALPVELAKTPNPVVVLDRKSIEQSGAATLGDLLQLRMPGSVLSSGGVGSAASIYLNGTRPQDTVVTLDGLRLNDTAGLGGVNANVLGLVGIDRVEVQQGPSSTRFGSDALGGAVALYSAGAAPAGMSGELRGAVGNQGVRRAGLGLAYGWDGGWLRTAVSVQRQDQILDAANPYRSVGTYLGLGQQVGQDSIVTLNYLNTYSGVPLPIAYVSQGFRSYSAIREDRDRIQVASGTWRTQISETLSGEVSLGQVLENRLEPNSTTNLPTDPYNSQRNQVVGRLSWRPSDLGSLSLGVDGSAERANTPDLTESTFLNGSARHLAVLAEAERELGAGLRAVLSARTERDHQGVSGLSDNAVTQTTGKAGLNWALPLGFRVYANAGTGFSNPLLYQVMFNSVYGGGALDNEKSHAYQAGASFAQGPWSASADLSRTLYSNLVFYDFNGGVPIAAWGGYLSGIYRNGAQIRVQSTLLKAGYQTGTWGLSGFYRNQEARDLLAAAGSQLNSDAVLRRPFQTLGLNGFQVLGPVRLEAIWSWIGPRYDAGLSQGAAFKEHFNDLTLSAAWTVRPDLMVTLRGEHLMQPRTSLADWQNGRSDFQNDASQTFGNPAQPPTGTLEVRYRF